MREMDGRDGRDGIVMLMSGLMVRYAEGFCDLLGRFSCVMVRLSRVLLRTWMKRCSCLRLVLLR